MEFKEIKPGLQLSVQKVVTEKDTALDFGTGQVTDLLATPVFAALVIEASVKLIDPHLPDQYISVGKLLNLTHDSPTTTGMTVTVKAEVRSIEANRVTLHIDAYDEVGIVGTAKHVRILVNRNNFVEKIDVRCRGIENLDR
jgi:predicted thioesterase